MTTICGYEVEVHDGRKDRRGGPAPRRYTLKGITHSGGKPIMFRSMQRARSHVLVTVERGKYAGKD